MAKKEWELSHLQQLREQEERMVQEEEEEQEAMCLTYDRPELVNKVIFRRRLSTGTWEVCTDHEASHTFNPDYSKMGNFHLKTDCFKQGLQTFSKCNSRNNDNTMEKSDPDYYPLRDVKGRTHRFSKKSNKYDESFQVTQYVDSSIGISSRTRQRHNHSNTLFKNHSSIKANYSVSDTENAN